MGNKKGKDSKQEEAPEATSDASASAMKLKLLVMGSKGVGKTQVILRFADNTFTDNFRYKIPNGMKEKELTVDGQRVLVQVIDSSDLKTDASFYRGASGILVGCDLTRPETLQDVAKWLNEADRFGGDGIPKIVLGMKKDLERKVTAEEGQAMADKHGLKYFETSALEKTNNNVQEAFACIIKAMKEREETL